MDEPAGSSGAPKEVATSDSPQTIVDLGARREIAAIKVRLNEVEAVSSSQSSSSTGEDVMPGPTREEMDAKVAASEARTDTKFARIEGKLDALSNNVALGRAEAATNRTAIITTMIGTGLALAGLIAAMLSYGASTFYNGTVLRDLVKSEVGERPQTSPQK